MKINMKKKFKNIKPGEIVVGMGIITKIDLTYNDTFYEQPNVEYLCYSDPYHGRCGQTIDVKHKYKIITKKKQIFKIYKRVYDELAKNIRDRVEEIEILIDFGYEGED